MTTADGYSERCEQLFLAGGLAGVRRTAAQGLDEAGPHADLYCWLAVAHASEDDDDHDTEAERAFRKGLALDADHPGLLAGYAELCLRSDSFEYPGRAARAVELTRRLEELAPDSPENAQLRAAHRWAARGYWEDLRMSAAEGAVRRQALETQSDEIAEALRGRRPEEARAEALAAAAARPDDRRAAVLADTLEALSGPGNGPLRWAARHRAEAWAVSFALSALTSLLLRTTGVVHGFGPWGLLWMVPMLLADARLTSVRREAERLAVARLEARLSGSEETGTAAGAATADAGA
ncbi:hypothetical protein [Streptomyces sp. ITFR-6]|uniref:hypothetical protein n=1 Tax=Streptomyces sp. ITFR-6 TaxID=3075197 RepID=UPI00288A79C9|nr:hypothetical protein [Streptomyces sp. ITFR-6]WNI29117.1 hypothetical protein RLT59_10250 [Streptomyces sp. ITFR-6]